MTKHKATPEQWAADRYDWAHADTEALDGNSAFRCIMELRSRVEALEAAQRPTETVKESLTVPADSLVERVADAISINTNWVACEQARAAILAVADWLDQKDYHGTAAKLRQEVG